MPVGRSLDPRAHDEPAHGEVVQLGQDGDGPPERVEGVRELAHGDEGLAGHGPRVLVDLQDVHEADVDLVHRVLVRHVLRGDRLPSCGKEEQKIFKRK